MERLGVFRLWRGHVEDTSTVIALGLAAAFIE